MNPEPKIKLDRSKLLGFKPSPGAAGKLARPQAMVGVGGGGKGGTSHPLADR